MAGFRHAGRRAVAAMIDGAVVAVPLAVVAAVNGLAVRRGTSPPISLAGRPRLLVPALVTIPAALVLGIADARGGTPGMRALGLAIEPVGGGDLTVGAAVLRRALTTALPWELAHQGVWSARGGRSGAGALLLGSSYACLIGLAVQAGRGDGRTAADVIAGTVVLDVHAVPAS